MKYSDDFKRRVSKLFCNNEEINKRLEAGDVLIGRYLDESPNLIAIKPQELIDAVDKKDMAELYSKAKALVEANNLYGEWVELHQNEIQQTKPRMTR